MSLAQDVGQLLHIGGIIGGLGEGDQEARILDAIAAGKIGGVYLGYPHFSDPAAALDITSRLQDLSPVHLFVAVDFENGPAYNCAAGCAHLPYLMGLGFVDAPDVTRDAAEITARQALAMGINWIYSPCLDVNLCPENPIIGIRSFGETSELVSRMGRAFVDGFKSVGVLSTAKHFPGTGNTRVDTHEGGACDLGDLETWEQKTLPPFAEAVCWGVDAVMSGHAAMPFLDPEGGPATFSKPIMTGVLRERLGFEGIIISDSLGMDGAAGGMTVAERCLMAFEAGCDVMVTPYDPDTVPLFERALADGRVTRKRLDESLQRIGKARDAAATLPPAEIRPADETRAIEIGRKAAHVQRGADHLPLQPGTFAVLTQWRSDEAQYFPRELAVLSRLQHGLQRYDPGAPLVAITRDCPEHEHDAVIEDIGDRGTVVITAIVKNYARDPYHGLLSEGTVALAGKLAAAGRQIVLAILGTPYVAAQAPRAGTVICTGGDSPGCADGVLDLLTGATAS